MITAAYYDHISKVPLATDYYVHTMFVIIWLMLSVSLCPKVITLPVFTEYSKQKVPNKMDHRRGEGEGIQFKKLFIKMQ